jgi:transglutaminase-like putative cysteine protease
VKIENLVAGLLLGIGLAAGVALAGDDTPQWLRDAAAAPQGTYDRKVPAVELLREEQVTVDASGRTERVKRGVIRILNRDGRDYAVARMMYDTSTDKVKDFRGWLLPASGAPIRYKKDRLIDAALVGDEIYSEARVRVFAAGSDAQDGSVFGYELTAESKSVFTQFNHLFQTSLPVAVSRYSLTLPAGWEVRSVTFNHAPVEPRVAGSTYTWELHDLPFVEDEPHCPMIEAVVPRVAITYLPPEGNPAGLRGMKDWEAVSRWMADLEDPQADAAGGLVERARALTAGATTDLAKIQAIASFVQGIKYVEIDTSVGRGGGYKPHLASLVLEKQYGDCKDKANLMRALLKAVGIDAYMVSIFSGDRSYVHPEWPSPQPFNHAIIAVKVPDSVELPVVITHPRLGRLLIFDPTSSYTPVGDLPESEQGSYALIDGADQNALVKMPLLPASANRVESVVDATVSAQGELVAVKDDSCFGQSAARLRRALTLDKPSEVRETVERGLALAIGTVKLGALSHKDAREQGRLELHTEFTADQFGQIMQGRLLIMKPGVVVAAGHYFFPAAERKLAIVLHAAEWSDTVRLRLPDGYRVDEVPDPVELSGPYGHYKASWTPSGNQVLFRQALEIKDIAAPPQEYKAVRDFFGRVYGAESAPVVLVRQ